VILQKYPKASIELCILVLQSDGGEWPACVLASSLAIADAGIEMFGLVLAATVGRVPPPAPAAGAGATSSASAALAASGASSRVLVDLSGVEEAASTSSTTVAYCRSLDRILHTNHQGELGVSELVHDTGFALETCAVVERVARQVLVAAEARKASKPAPAAAGAGGIAALSAT
jgi:ribonuclease PH